MATIKQVKRRQNIQMAEGYLDLAMVLDDRWPLEVEDREALIQRAISCLENIKHPLGHKPYILFLKGQAMRASGRLVDAVNYLEQSSKLDPENLHTYLALAWCYKRTDRLPQAIESMRIAVELDSENAIGQYNLACYFALNKQVELSLLHLSFALELNPDFRALASDESDFDLIRENPGFASLTSLD